MATIGNSLAPYFTATTSDVFSANGSGTTFTLTRSISNLVDIEVLVNNIQQNPFNGAYSVNGNTLTFSEAPSVGANNVLVNYRQAVIGSSIPTPNTVASISLQRDLTLGGNTTSNGTMFTQALVPTANVTYDIGTSTLRYKDIYLSGATINLGDVSLSASGNTFTVANSTGGTLPSSMGNTTITGTANVTGDMTIGGNLTVTGTMTYINTTDLNIGDAIISLNADLAANIAPTEDAGISINRGASTNAQFKWIESTDNWSLGNTTISGILTSNDHVITGTANVSSAINVGANVNLSTSQINVGNSTVNTVISSSALTTTSNTATFGTAVYIAANGNLGIGIGSPSYRGHFRSTGTSSIVRADRSENNSLYLEIGADGNGGVVNGSPAVLFQTTGTERARIDSSGNLGVGTTAPTTRLSINTSTQNSEAATIGGIDYSGTKRGLSIRTYQSLGGDDCGVEFNAAPSNSGYGAFKFSAANTTLAILSANGNLGIGTSSPAQLVDAYKSANADVVYQITNDNSGSSATAQFFASNGSTRTQFFHTGGSYSGAGVLASAPGIGGIYNTTAQGLALISAHASGVIKFATGSSNTERMRIDSSGNLRMPWGSGKISWYYDGSYEMGLATDASSRSLYIDNKSSDSGGAIIFRNTINGTLSEKMSLDSSGNLTVAGNIRSFVSPSGITLNANQYTDIMYIGAGGYGSIMSGILTVYSTYSGAVTQNSYFVNAIGNGGGTGITMLANGNYSSPATTILYDRGNGVLGGGSRVISVYNATGTTIVISFSFTPVGQYNSAAFYTSAINGVTAGAGTGVPSSDPVYFGQNYAQVKAANIIFPSSQSASTDANCLDDYEEGNWTPNLTGSIGGTYTMGGSNSGRYVKIGKMIFVTATVHWTAVSAGYSGNLVVSGLPYPCGTNRAAGTVGAVSSGLTFTAGYGEWHIVIDPNQFFIYVIQSSTTGSGYAHNPTVGSSGLVYSISLVYEAGA